MGTILATIDFSSATESVLAAAEHLAHLGPSRIVLVHVFAEPIFADAYLPVTDNAALAREKAAQDRLQEIQQRLQSRLFEADISLLFGEAGPAIVAEALRQEASYIVLGSQGHGILRRLLEGSSTVYVLNQAPCPLLIVPVNADLQATLEPRRDIDGALQSNFVGPGSLT